MYDDSSIGTTLNKLRHILKQTRVKLVQGFYLLPSLLVMATLNNNDGTVFLTFSLL